MRYGPAKSRFRLDDKKHLAKNVPLGELIYLDRERCIQCGRCVRFQAEVAGDPVIGFDQRGRATQIITCSDPGFDSIFSGNTTDICPVGALTSADFRFGARPWELKSRESLCTHCPVGCNISIDIRREARSDGEVVVKRILPRQNEAVNGIWICDKGRFAHHFTDPQNRILKPLIRKSNKLAQSQLDNALDLIASKMRRKGSRLITLAGGRLSNEDLFNVKQLTLNAKGKSYLYSYMSGGELTRSAGLAPDTSLEDLKKGNVILVIASDLHEEAPLYWLRVKQAVERGATLVVLNGRETRLDGFATHVIHYRYGDETRAIARLLKGSDPASREIKKAKGLLIFAGADGLGVQGSAAVMSAAEQLLTSAGFTGKPGSGLVAVWERANTQGAWEMGYEIAGDLEKVVRGADVLIIAGADPLGDFPELSEAFQSVKFLAVLELSMTPTAEIADVVLPVAAFTERSGTFTSAERRVQIFHAAVDLRPGVLPDHTLVAMLGRRLGIELSENAPETFARIGEIHPTFKGLTYDVLSTVQEQWPIVGGRSKYFSGTVAANNLGVGARLPLVGEVKKIAVKLEKHLEYSSKKLWAVPISSLYDHGTTLGYSRLLEKRMVQYTVRLHPNTAATLNIQTGPVVISLEKHTQPVACILDKSAPEGFVLVPRSAGIPIHEVGEARLVMAASNNQNRKNR